MTERTGPQAFRALQARARHDGRGTEELLVLYAHEGFLRRLSQSGHRRALVLKGGLLMAVLHARRPTRDADLSVHGLPGGETSVRRFITEIATVSANDGLEFDITSITTAAMRADADYQGVRVVIPAALATARIKVQLDLSFGDPFDAREISYPTLLDDRDISLLGYPIELTLAEKITTMMSRGKPTRATATSLTSSCSPASTPSMHARSTLPCNAQPSTVHTRSPPCPACSMATRTAANPHGRRCDSARHSTHFRQISMMSSRKSCGSSTRSLNAETTRERGCRSRAVG